MQAVLLETRYCRRIRYFFLVAGAFFVVAFLVVDFAAVAFFVVFAGMSASFCVIGLH
jgi:uncharacterized membrane protein